MLIEILILFFITAVPFPESITGNIEITSTTLTAYKNENKIVFEGNVRVKSSSDDIIIYSEVATAFYSNGFKDIKGVIARGNVKMTYKDKIGNCSEIEYDPSSGLVIFKGEPVIWDNNSRIKGNVIKYYLREEFIKVEKADVYIKKEK